MLVRHAFATIARHHIPPTRQVHHEFIMEALKSEYDVVASETLHHLRSAYGNQGDLYSQLEQYHSSDPVLEQFWQAIRTIPAWVDWGQIERGQLVCKRYAIPVVIGFAFQGFAGEIAAALGPAEVLGRTGGLSQRNIFGRVKATLRWLTEVTRSPDSLSCGWSRFCLYHPSPTKTCCGPPTHAQHPRVASCFP